MYQGKGGPNRLAHFVRLITSSNNPPNLQCVATLPCDMSVL